MCVVRRELEITVRTDEPNDMSAVGILDRYPDVEVLARRSYCDREGGVLLLVPTDADRALGVLEAAGFRCRTNPIVLVGPFGNAVLAAPIGVGLAILGIEILYSYASHLDHGRDYLVFKTSDDDQSIRMIEESLAVRRQRAA
jgi:hypothetical protein